MLIKTRLYFIVLFVLIASISPAGFVKAQTREIDSLKNVVNTARQDTNKVIMLNNLAYQIYPYDIRELRRYSDEALALSLKLKYQRGEAVAYKNLAISFMLFHGDATALAYLDKALNILQGLNDNANSAIVLNYIGCYYATIKDHQQAIVYFNKALDKLSSVNKAQQLVILSNAGNHYEDANQLNKALEFYNRMLLLARELHSDENLVRCYNNFASVYLKQNNYSAAIDYCNKALSLIRSSKISPRNCQRIYILLGDINYKLKDYGEARALYLKSAAIANQMKSREYMDVIYHSLYLLDSVKGDFRSAMKNYYHYSVLKDSLVNLDKNNVIALYQVKFEVEKREEENKRLRIIEDRNKFIISHQRATIIVTVIGLLIIFGGLIYLKKINNYVKARNKVINEQNRQLENSNHVKDTIFSVISHDLRNPISQIIGLLNLLDDEDISFEEIAILIPALKNTSINSLELLDNLLIWSKNQLQGFAFTPVVFDMREVVNGTIKQMRAAIDQKNLTVVNNIADTIKVSADQEMVTAVIRNLISNAIKFTPERGTIEINGSIADDYAIIGVSDNGIGINEKDQHKIFSFTSHTTLGTALEKGTGVGLKICSDFMRLNKGTIWMKSKENAGSTFFISLPSTIDVDAQNEKLVMI